MLDIIGTIFVYFGLFCVGVFALGLCCGACYLKDKDDGLY